MTEVRALSRAESEAPEALLAEPGGGFGLGRCSGR